MEKFEIYEALRAVPLEAQRVIKAGKLKGFTDINPMWRIKAMTELFGVCGYGWRYRIAERWVDEHNGQVFASVKVALSIKVEGVWSEEIEGVGGSMMYGKGVGDNTINDECWKMALTDAIGIACKSLGMAGDIYFAKDRSKYHLADQPINLTQLDGRISEVADMNELKAIWAEIKEREGCEGYAEARRMVARKNKELTEGGDNE